MVPRPRTPLEHIIVVDCVRCNCFPGVFIFRGCRHERLLTDYVAEALEVQLVDPVFDWQLPALLWIRSGAEQRIGTEAEALGHLNVILIQAAELLCFRPAALLFSHFRPDGFERRLTRDRAPPLGKAAAG